jgi:hypothetical protein
MTVMSADRQELVCPHCPLWLENSKSPPLVVTLFSSTCDMGDFYVCTACSFCRVRAGGERETLDEASHGIIRDPGSLCGYNMGGPTFVLSAAKRAFIPIILLVIYAMEMEEEVEVQGVAFRWWEFLLSRVLESRAT